MQLHKVGNGPQGQDELDKLARQDKMTSPSQKVHFNKERDRQVVRFNEKLTRYQPITKID
jgi:hypothetical protein